MKTRTSISTSAVLALVLAASPHVEASQSVASATSSAAAAAAASATRLRLPLHGEFNVLVIVLDDLGTDQLAMYANDAGLPSYCASTQLGSVPTPNLDALRDDGVLFTRCYANPTCSPTRAALLTGRYGKRTGIGHAINPGDSPAYALPGAEIALPELLRDANTGGYARGAFGKWHLADYTLDDCHPADTGFETFEGHTGNVDAHFDWRKVSAIGGTIAGCTSSSSQPVPLVAGSTPTEQNWSAGVTRIDAESWIVARGTSPWFAYVAFNSPHAPFQCPPYRVLSQRTQARLAFLGYEAGDIPRAANADDRRLLYHANIEGIDFEIGRLVGALSPAVLAKTMIFVVGDNGTVADVIADPSMASHGKRTLFELGTRVPLIVAGPLVRSPGSTCRELVGVVDLWRTVAHTTGLRESEIAAAVGATSIDSQSFFKQIQLPTAAGPRTIAYSEAFPNGTPPPALVSYRRGMTDGTHRYMRIYDDVGAMSESFYDQAADPCEATDLLNPPVTLTPTQSSALAALQAAMNTL